LTAIKNGGTAIASIERFPICLNDKALQQAVLQFGNVVLIEATIGEE
jgi:hypothetical protein